jgi:hypothetical protein
LVHITSVYDSVQHAFDDAMPKNGFEYIMAINNVRKLESVARLTAADIHWRLVGGISHSIAIIIVRLLMEFMATMQKTTREGTWNGATRGPGPPLRMYPTVTAWAEK